MVFVFRFMRRTQQRSRTMVFGWGTRVGLATTTCTRSSVTPLLMVLLISCTMRWLHATGYVSHAFRLSRLPPSQLSSARGRAPNNSITPRSSSHWFSRKSDHQPGSSRPPTRPRSPTCLCNVVEFWKYLWWLHTFLLFIYCLILLWGYLDHFWLPIFLFLLDIFPILE